MPVEITDKRAYNGLAILEFTLLICTLLHIAKVGSLAHISPGGQGALLVGTAFILCGDILIALRRAKEVAACQQRKGWISG